MGRVDAGRPLGDELLRLANRDRAAREDVVDDLLGALARVLRNLGHEPDLESDLRAEPLARDEVAPSGAADLGENERRDDGRDDPETHLGEPEDRVGPRNGDVGARHEPAAAAEREAVHAADHRRGARVDRLEHGVQPHRVLDVLVVGEVDRRSLPLDVRAGAERWPLAFEEHRARVSDVRERVGELGDEVGVESVATLRLRERHSQDVPVPNHPQRAHRPGA